MASVLAQSSNADASFLESSEALVQSLDILLERYLNLLDSYQSSRERLTGHLSSGYLSLAEANFKSLNRIRYGQDFYDQRMQASVKINVEEFTATNVRSVSLAPNITQRASNALYSPEAVEFKEAETDTDKSGSSDSDATSQKSLGDPLNWFGILVPPPLRTAQASFQSAVEEAVPGLVYVTRQMQSIESEVEGLRQKLRSIENR